MRITVTDWAYENCICANAPVGNWAMPWGYSIVENDSTIAVYRHVCGNVIRETEKAVQIEYTLQRFNNRCDLVGKSVNWHVWIPKKCLVNDHAVYFDGGQSQWVDKYVMDAMRQNKNLKSTWAFH